MVYKKCIRNLCIPTKLWGFIQKAEKAVRNGAILLYKKVKRGVLYRQRALRL